MNFKRIILLALPIIFVCSAVQAAAFSLQADSTSSLLPANVRSFNKAKLDSLKAQPDFDYVTQRFSANNFADLIMAWLWYNFLRHIFNPQTAIFWEITAYVLAIGAVVFIVRRLTKSSASALFYKTTGNQVDTRPIESEDIRQLDLQQMLNDFLREKKYRQAVRTVYLMTLKKLSDDGHIKWRIGKTNHQYSAELSGPELKTLFNQLTLFYEYVWYGDFPISAATFKAFTGHFDQLKILSGKAA